MIFHSKGAHTMRLNFESLVYDLPEDVLRAELA